MARFLAEPLKQRSGRNVLIDNKAGASGTIAIEALKNSAPDGTTIAYVPSATIVQKLTMDSVPFDPLTDIQPITLAGTCRLPSACRRRSASIRCPNTSNG